MVTYPWLKEVKSTAKFKMYRVSSEVNGCLGVMYGSRTDGQRSAVCGIMVLEKKKNGEEGQRSAQQIDLKNDKRDYAYFLKAETAVVEVYLYNFTPGHLCFSLTSRDHPFNMCQFNCLQPFSAISIQGGRFALRDNSLNEFVVKSLENKMIENGRFQFLSQPDRDKYLRVNDGDYSPKNEKMEYFNICFTPCEDAQHCFFNLTKHKVDVVTVYDPCSVKDECGKDVCDGGPVYESDGPQRPRKDGPPPDVNYAAYLDKGESVEEKPVSKVIVKPCERLAFDTKVYLVVRENNRYLCTDDFYDPNMY